MEKKKALLILSGGRAMPNMLTVIHEKPALIVAIVSQDEIDKLGQLQSSIDALFRNEVIKPSLKTSYVVDAFNFHDVQEKCQQAIKDHPGYDWIFNITAATKIMGLGAYEVAKKLSYQDKFIRCWYLDTAHANVVALIGEPQDNTLFDISIDQYAAVYNCRLSSGTIEDQDQRQFCENHWIPFSRFLIQNPQYIDTLKKVLKHIKSKGQPAKQSNSIGSKNYSIPAKDEICLLSEKAYQVGLLDYLERNGDNVDIALSCTQFNFLEGPWLEVYAWDEARKLNLFSDCRWNQKIIDENKLDDKESKNELDVAMIYNAQLIIAECKTGEQVLGDTDVLYKLDSVAGPLGGNFVSKILITSQAFSNEKDQNKQRSYQAFQDKAKERRITLVTRENLSRVGEIIAQQAKNLRNAR